MTKLYRSSGPHIESSDSVSRNMWEVSLALLPATAAAGFFFGPYALYLVFASAFSAAILEQPFVPGGFSIKRPLGDGSAFLAGLLYGLTLAPGSPWWVPFFGAVIIVFVGKQAFGGIGHNVFNPALVARGILLLAYPALVTEWWVPMEYDVVTAATPLAGVDVTYLQLFLGNVAGSIGETSALALVIGAVYLFARGFVGWRISLGYLGGSVITAIVFGVDPVFTILAGSIMFAALFMATDMVTSPVGRTARLIYGIGCGILTVVIRELTQYPEGTTFAVLIMNGVTPIIDVTVVDTFFGEVTKRARRITAVAAVLIVAVLATVVGYGTGALDQFARSNFVDGTVRRDLGLFFEDARYALPYESERDSVRVEQVFRDDEPLGYLVYASEQGYKSEIRVVLALDTNERIIGTRIVDQNESGTLGTLVRRPSFLRQFLRRSTSNPDAVVDSLEAISGATVSSRAVARAVRDGLSFRIAPEPPPGQVAIENDGVFEGSGAGYAGRISVEVVVEGGEITAINVLSHSETPGIGEPAFGTIIDVVLETQSLEVDTVSGATGSSQGILAAIADALGQ